MRVTQEIGEKKMPNWVTNKLVITGSDKYLNTLRDQLNKSYATHHYDVFTESITHNTTEGVFLLWNIVRPTNLEAYYEYDKLIKRAEDRKNAPPSEPMDIAEILEKASERLQNTDFGEFMEKFESDLSVGQDWYHWNIREWGTKWEISGASLSQKPNELIYNYATAWSPPAEALDKLAAQYPHLVFTTRFIDEGDCFAGEVHWQNGKREFESDLFITHGLYEEMYGECWACASDDPDDEERRKELGCARFKETIEIGEFNV